MLAELLVRYLEIVDVKVDGALAPPLGWRVPTFLSDAIHPLLNLRLVYHLLNVRQHQVALTVNVIWGLPSPLTGFLGFCGLS